MQTRKTPRQWAQAKGHTWQVAATAAMHGWDRHEHDAGAEIQITESEYDGAVAAACPKRGAPSVHRPALSPYAKSTPASESAEEQV
jgi:hypothetical protein